MLLLLNIALLLNRRDSYLALDC